MEKSTAAACLPEELVVEVLARLPAESLGCFKCVSRSWRALISDPALRARLAQSLSGFFFLSNSCPPWRFAALPAFPAPVGGDGGPPLVYTALSFLTPTCREMGPLDSCHGLLLLRCSRIAQSSACKSYVVCNPATREWVALPFPQPRHTVGEDEKTYSAALGFDPAISSHFHVFQLVVVQQQVRAVEIYSSETGRWIRRESGWSPKNKLVLFTGCMSYSNGRLYFTLLFDALGSVDTKGQSWRVIPHVRYCGYYGQVCGYVGHCEGRLLYVDDGTEDNIMSIYVLEDQDSDEWILKHSNRKLDLFELGKSQWEPNIAAFHPDGNLIFFQDGQRLISYNMNHGDWNVICDLGDVAYAHSRRPFLPYVPFYKRLLASRNVN